MNPVTVRPALTPMDARDHARRVDARRCSGRVDRAIRAAQAARIALQRAGV